MSTRSHPDTNSSGANARHRCSICRGQPGRSRLLASDLLAAALSYA
jgi:hypothetical protein